MTAEVEQKVTGTEEVAEQTENQTPGQETEPVKAEDDAIKQLADAKAEIAKITQQLKSIQGSSRAALDNMADLKALRREVSLLTRLIPAIAKGQVNPEEAQVDIQRMTEAHRQEETQEVYEAQAYELYKELYEEAGDAGLDLVTAGEFVEVRNIWNSAFQAKSLRDMREAVKRAKEVRRQAQVMSFEQEEATKKKAAGILKTPVIRSSGGGKAPNLEELSGMDTRRMTPKQLAEHETALTKAMLGRT